MSLITELNTYFYCCKNVLLGCMHIDCWLFCHRGCNAKLII